MAIHVESMLHQCRAKQATACHPRRGAVEAIHRAPVGPSLAAECWTQNDDRISTSCQPSVDRSSERVADSQREFVIPHSDPSALHQVCECSHKPLFVLAGVTYEDFNVSTIHGDYLDSCLESRRRCPSS